MNGLITDYKLKTNIISYLITNAWSRPTATAYVFPLEGIELSNAEVLAAVQHTASKLLRLCEAGDRIAIQLPQGKDYVIVFWACLYAGMIAVPLYPSQKKETHARLARTISDCGARYVVVADASEPNQISARALMGDHETVEPWSGGVSDLAYIQYSSGSTGIPKGVMISNGNILANVAMISRAADVTGDDVFVSWLPLHHDLGLVNTVLLPARMGCKSVITTPLSFMRNPASWLSLISQHEGTISGGPNFAYELCVNRLRSGQLDHLNLATWRVAFNAAEPIQVETLKRFSQQFESVGFHRQAFFAAYGMAEATVFVSGAFWEEAWETEYAGTVLSGQVEQTINCGPASPAELVVVGPDGDALAEGNLGEIWIRGANVSSGYFEDRPSAESPFKAYTAAGDGPFFRTGDSGTILRSRLYVLGRIKEVIIQNGRNLYPTDIEAIIAAELSKDRRFSTVAVIGKAYQGTETPIAVVEMRSPCGAEDLRQLWAVAGLVFEQLDVVLQEILVVAPGSVQRTSSGKLKRIELRRQIEAGEIQYLRFQGDAADIPLHDNADLVVEKEICTLVCSMLDVERIDPTRSLFSYGLSSLQLSQLAMKIETLYGRSVSPRSLFENPSARHIANLIRQSEGEVSQLDVSGVASGLTCNQHLMLSIEMLSPGHRGYHLPLVLRLSGQIDQDRLKAAVERIVTGHEILRTVYPAIEGGAHIAEVRDAADFEVAVQQIEVGDIAAAIEAFVAVPFSIRSDVPARAGIFTLEDSPDVILALVFHHIAVDGWSLKLLLDEVIDAYLRPSSEALTPVKFYRHRIPDDLLERSLGYWRAHLHGLPVVHSLPLDGARHARREKKGRRHDVVMSPAAVENLQTLCAAAGATLFSGLHAFFAIALARMGNEPDIAIGTFLAGRDWAGDDQRIGFLAQTTILRTRLNLRWSVNETIAHCHEILSQARKNSDVSYLDLLRELQPARNATYNPLFQITLNLHDYDALPVQTPELAVARIPVDLGVSRFDLGLDVYMAGQEIRLSFEYDSDLFADGTIELLASYFIELVTQGAASHDHSVGALRADNLLPKFEATAGRVGQDLYSLFEKVAAQRPGAFAIRFHSDTWTYGRLECEVGRIAGHLQTSVRPGDRVVIFTRRTPAYIAALLAILSLDATYIPIDPDFYQDAIEEKLHFIDPACLLVDQDTCGRFEGWEAKSRVINLSNLPEQVAAVPVGERSGAHPAYILFTSGSTGAPKAVAMGHGPLINLVEEITSSADISAPTILHYSSIAFDMHFTEVFCGLLLGGIVVLADEATRLDSLSLLRLIAAEHISVLNLSYPVMCELAIASNQSRIGLPSVKVVLSTAQQLKIIPNLRAFFKRHVDARLYNHYGPTETHVVTIAALPASPDEWPEVPDIGRAIAGADCFVINSIGTPEPHGFHGELCVAGEAVADGYYANAAMTHERFKAFTVGQGQAVRAYQTGDFARRKPNGVWYYLGRRDHQIKIRGLRVDLSDIEASIQQCDGVQQATVIAKTAGEAFRLVAFVQAAHDTADPRTRLDRIEEELRRRLPSYMLPGNFVLVDKFELNQNGKIDLSRLPTAEDDDQIDFEPPATPEEHFVYGIWRRVLSHDRFGRRTNFFEAGGDSMTLMTVKREMDLWFGTQIDLVKIYGSPTIADLAALGSVETETAEPEKPRKQNLNILRRQRAASQT